MQPVTQPVQSTSGAPPAGEHRATDFLQGTTLNLMLDGYYGYNFNTPVGRVNLLRAYDVSSNSFSLNQATVVLERAPDVSLGRRFGARVECSTGKRRKPSKEALRTNCAPRPIDRFSRPTARTSRL